MIIEAKEFNKALVRLFSTMTKGFSSKVTSNLYAIPQLNNTVLVSTNGYRLTTVTIPQVLPPLKISYKDVKSLLSKKEQTLDISQIKSQSGEIPKLLDMVDSIDSLNKPNLSMILNMETLLSLFPSLKDTKNTDTLLQFSYTNQQMTITLKDNSITLACECAVDTPFYFSILAWQWRGILKDFGTRSADLTLYGYLTTKDRDYIVDPIEISVKASRKNERHFIMCPQYFNEVNYGFC